MTLRPGCKQESGSPGDVAASARELPTTFRLFGEMKVLRYDLRQGRITNERLGEWLAENIDHLIALDPIEQALDLLAREPHESGTELGELIEERRGSVYRVQ